MCYGLRLKIGGSELADIFISYARADRERVADLAEALSAKGFSIWWDTRLKSGDEYSADIERELNQAAAVIVCWSNNAAGSHWVKDEATIAANQNKLLALSLDGAPPPIGFRQYHCVDLSHADSPLDHALIDEIVAAAEEKTGARRALGDAPTTPPGGAPMAPINVKILAAAGGVLLAALIGAAVFTGGFRGGSERADAVAMAEKSIAVLPFVALSTDQNDTFFGEGVAEELLNSLAHLPDLKVAARTSAFSFREEGVPLSEIGDRLGVNYIVEGSVRRAGDRLRISAQLLRAEDGVHLWAETYERRIEDIFAIEDEIVREITRALQVRLGVGGYRARANADGVDPVAYEAYLRGLSHYGNRMRNNQARLAAVDSLLLAVEADPEFAAAWTALAAIGTTSAGSPAARDHETFNRRTDNAFKRALALDPESGETHALLSIWKRRSEISLTEAKNHLRKAEALDGNSATTLFAAAHYYGFVGDVDKADQAYARALRIDNLNIAATNGHAHYLAQTGRTVDAFAFFEECFETACLQEGFLAFVMTYAAYTGDADLIARWRPRYEAFEAQLDGIPTSQKPRITEILPALMSILLDRPDKQALIAEVTELYRVNPVTEYVGLWGPLLADALPEDVYFDALERAFDNGQFFSELHALDPFFGVNPYPDWVLRHPRYVALWRAAGMQELAAARRANGWIAGLPIEASE